jgi:hypothetical protein
MKIDKSLMTGSATMLILKLLENSDMYGYQLKLLDGKKAEWDCLFGYSKSNSWLFQCKKEVLTYGYDSDKIIL